jgi:guanine deaminase
MSSHRHYTVLGRLEMNSCDPAHVKLMREAFEVARQSFRDGGGPFGTIIVCDNEVVARGMSLAEKLHDPTAHAEVSAIRAAAKALARIDLSDCVAYSSAEPCPMCLAAFYWSRISAVYYGSDAIDAAAFGFEDSYVYAELAKMPTSRSIVCRSLLRNEALRLLSDADRERHYTSFLPSGWHP